MPAKVITEILDKYATAPKSNMQALEDHELSIVFEHLTQNNQISNIAAIYADEPKKPEAPKVEAPKAEAPKPAAVVKKVDINRALPSVEGGTAGSNPVPEHHADNAPALKLANGTTLQIDINPDGGISIKITTGK